MHVCVCVCVALFGIGCYFPSCGCQSQVCLTNSEGRQLVDSESVRHSFKINEGGSEGTICGSLASCRKEEGAR
jgi:hypothetical protein